MARYMLICRALEANPMRLNVEKVGFIRYFATKDEALFRAERWKKMKYAEAAVEVCSFVYDTKNKVWL